MDQNSEKELEKYILNHVLWESLPSHAKAILDHSTTKYKQYVLKYSIKHQLRWKTNLISNFVNDERLYYQEIVRFSVANLVLYPYHIQDKLVIMQNVTPFKYYSIMLIELMSNSKSYDELPNFTAVDCIRVLDIGRNQYIDLMNRCRSKGFLFKKKRDVIKSLLPTRSVEKIIEYWWVLRVGFIQPDEERSCSNLELDILEELRRSPKQAGIFPRDSVLSLVSKGLVFIDVPILNSDMISVPPLEGFVMNRVQGDYFENLLYTIFLSIDERTTVSQLSDVIQIDVELVKQAVSLYCRLGFAKKKNLEPLVNNEESNELDSSGLIKTRWHQSWITYYQNTPGSPPTLLPTTNNPITTATTENITPSTATTTTTTSTTTIPSTEISSNSTTEIEEQTENQSPLTRIGFIFDSSMTAFLMMGNLGYGLKNHAVTMFEVGKLTNEALSDFLAELDKINIEEFVDREAKLYASNAIALRDTIRNLRNNPAGNGLDLLSCERINSLDETTRIRLLSRSYSVLISMAPLSIENCPVISCIPPNFGPTVYEVHSFWFRLYLYSLVGAGPNSLLFPKGTRLKKIPNIFRDCEKVCICSIDHDPTTVNLSQLLPTVNEILLSSPVLLQAYSYIKYEAAPKPSRLHSHSRSSSSVKDFSTTINIAFPIESTAIDLFSDNLVLTEDDYTEENMHRHPLVQKIQEVLGLESSFGYITMLKKEVPSSPMTSGGSSKISWIPLNVYFGIPIFNERLNYQVCEKISRLDLLSEDNMKKHSFASRKLSLDLFNFISSTCPPVHPDLDCIDSSKLNATLPSVQNIPLPTQTISFINGSIDF
eukprot:gene1393-1760_t